MSNDSLPILPDPTAPIDSSSVPVLISGQIFQVPIERLRADPDQPRAEIPEASLKSLAADIAARGIELPIVVDADLTIKDGERRWRAARIAGHTTVPCLLAPFATKGGTDWRLDQIADNHHREPLSPLDWARVLNELVDKHGIKVKDLPQLLEQRGITMSRSYCSNLMRLSELPDWAQAHIRSGTLTAAHGKHILTAKDSPAVLNTLQESIAKLAAVEGGIRDDLTTDDLQAEMINAFGEHHIRLNASYGDYVPRFDITTCDGCAHRKTFDRGYGERLFCLHRPCFDRKQAEVPAPKKTGVTRDGRPSRTTKVERETRERERKIRDTANAAALRELFAKFAKNPILLVEDVRTAAQSLLLEFIGQEIESAICEAFAIKKGAQPPRKAIMARLKGARLGEATGLFLALLAADAADTTYAFVDDAAASFTVLCKAHEVDLSALRKKAGEEGAPEKTAPATAKKSSKKKTALKPKASTKKKKARK